MQPINPYHNAETFQIGVTPVQAFESHYIPLPPGTTAPPRRGGPKDRDPEQNQQTPPPTKGENDAHS